MRKYLLLSLVFALTISLAVIGGVMLGNSSRNTVKADSIGAPAQSNFPLTQSNPTSVNVGPTAPSYYYEIPITYTYDKMYISINTILDNFYVNGSPRLYFDFTLNGNSQTAISVSIVFHNSNYDVTTKITSNSSTLLNNTDTIPQTDLLEMLITNNLFTISSGANIFESLPFASNSFLSGVTSITSHYNTNYDAQGQFAFFGAPVPEPQNYTVTFLDINGNVFNTQTYEIAYGEPVYTRDFPTPPTSDIATWGWTYDGDHYGYWQNVDTKNIIFDDVVFLTSDTILQAIYEYNVYNLTFVIKNLHYAVMPYTWTQEFCNYPQMESLVDYAASLNSMYSDQSIYGDAAQGHLVFLNRSDGKDLGDTFSQDITINFDWLTDKVSVYVTYYTVERIYYTKQNYFLWVIPTDTDYKYADVIVKRTDAFTCWRSDNIDPAALLGNGLYNIPKYLNVSGFEFTKLTCETSIQFPNQPVWEDVLHYTAQYNIPQVSINYYGSNGAFVETKTTDVKFVPLPELNGNLNWYEGFVKYFQDVIVKWNFVELADDIDGRARAKELIQYISDRYEQGKFEPVFMIIQPDVDISAAFGLFKSSAAAVSSSTFKCLMGTSENNDYVYYADLSGIYVTGLKYDCRVTFDTPYDNVVSFVGNAFNSVKSFVTGNIWWVVAIVLLIFCFPLVIMLFKFILLIIIAPFKWLAKKIGGS